MLSSASVPPLRSIIPTRAGRLDALLGLCKEALGRLRPLLVSVVTIAQSLGEAHPASMVAGQDQEAFPGLTPPGV